MDGHEVYHSYVRWTQGLEERLRLLIPAFLTQNFFQLSAQDFSRCCARNGVHKSNFPRLLVGSQALRHELAEFIFQFFGLDESFAQHHERDWNLTCAMLGLSHHPTVSHRRMLQQQRFHFRGCDGETLVLDHLLATVEHVIEILLT